MAYNSTSWTSEALSKAGGSVTQTVLGATSFKIKILPVDFMGNDDVNNHWYIEDDGSNYGGRIAHASTEIYAYIDVPTGFTATKVKINGSDTDDEVQVYTLDLDDGTISSEISNSSLTVGDDTDLSTNHVGADDKVLLVKIVTDDTSAIVYGGYVTLQRT